MSDAIPTVEEPDDQTARHEIKCVLEAGRVAEIESWIALHSAAFRRAYADSISGGAEPQRVFEGTFKRTD